MVHLAILASGELERYRASDSSEEMICHCFTHNIGGLEVARNQSKVIEFTILLRLARALYRAISAILCFAMESCILPLTGRGFRMFEDEVIESFTLPDFSQYRIYRIWGMVFTGLLPVTAENRGRLPKGRAVYSGIR